MWQASTKRLSTRSCKSYLTLMSLAIGNQTLIVVTAAECEMQIKIEFLGDSN